MATVTPAGRPTTPAPPETPPLQNGDRLSRDEFERRYDAMPELKKAELIDGVVYMPSPVRHREHGNPHFNLIAWLGYYVGATPGVEGGDNSSLRLDLANEPQPDACLIIKPAHGGKVQIDAEGYIAGAPEFVAEVAASSVSYDLHDKLNAYRRHQVQEYLVLRVYDRAIDWFVLSGGAYDRLAPTATNIYSSKVFPGLWLDAAALLSGDLAAVVRVLQQGTASAEHGAFVGRLQAVAGGPVAASPG
jgi:hypothetical protein